MPTPKVALPTLTAGYLSIDSLNDTFRLLETVFDDVLFHSDADSSVDPELTYTGGDTMTQPLDMNSNQIINLGAPTTATAAARYRDLTDLALPNITIAPLTGNSGKVLYTDGIVTAWVDLTDPLLNTPLLASGIAFTPYGNIAANTVEGAIQELDNEKVAKAGDTMTGLLVLSGDPVTALGAATKQYVDAAATAAPTGAVMPMYRTSAPAGWVIMEGGTIGNAVSGATARANADTEDLFNLLWNNVGNDWAYISGGRGASAAADFAANKAIKLPDMRGHGVAGSGLNAYTREFNVTAADPATDKITVPSAYREWQTGVPVVYAVGTGSVTGLTNGTTYYVRRISATEIQLCATQANALAQVPAVVNITGTVAGTFTLTRTFPFTLTIGEWGGFSARYAKYDDMPAHTHQYVNQYTKVHSYWAGGLGSTVFNQTQTTSAAGGSGIHLHNYQPMLHIPYFIKL